MLKPLVKESEIEAIDRLISSSENIVITCHLAPDGDALGSSLALYHLLTAMGKKVHVVTPDMPAAALMFIPGAKEIVASTRFDDFSKLLFSSANLVICLDFNTAQRVDRLKQTLENCTAPKILIDHHTDPDIVADVVVSHPEVSSTCMLLFRVICQLGWLPLVNRKIASCIYVGMMTDTGNFSYNSQDPDIYIIIAELLRKGIDKDRLYKLAFNTKTENELRIQGFALAERMTIFPEHQAAMISLTLSDLERFNYQPGDTEGLVNVPLSMPGVNIVVFFREGKDYVKVSTRSEGDIPVNDLCSRFFNGGGHKNAAGGEFYGSMEDAQNLFVSALPEYDKYLKNR